MQCSDLTRTYIDIIRASNLKKICLTMMTWFILKFHKCTIHHTVAFAPCSTALTSHPCLCLSNFSHRHVELMMVPGLHPAHCAMLSTLALFPNVLNQWRVMASWNETRSWSTFD